tara:strand:+ start:2964 stop:3176 length:213 start_codon:yes stop_codon:yes gene_type:complete
MEEFKYDSEKTRMQNYRVWKEMNDDEREIFNEKLLTPTQGARLFVKLYPKEKTCIIVNDEWRKNTIWERK